ncbi:glycosyltransferase [Microbacterium sp.]|uniref:glycosyltransferase n=1 Tax=Microbacterium sp. TaxID=51671 RepID=UPI003C19EA83
MTDLVVMSLERWDEVWRRNQHLMDGLLRSDPGLRVLFVEPPADPLHDIASRRRPARGSRLSEIRGVAESRLWRFRPVKWLPRRLDAHADKRLTNDVMRAARRLGMTQPLLWLNDPSATTLSMTTGWPTLYDMTDDWLAAARPAAELRRVAAAEKHLLTHAAEIVACSAELVRRKSPQRPPDREPIALIPNAVDIAAYRRATIRPPDLPNGRVALYVGTLHQDRLDVGLCEESARALAGESTLVLVGPNALGTQVTERLRRSGVLLLGERSRDAVIAYLQHADVLVVPHVVTPFTESLDPIKLYEYQAVGRPVVSTAVAGFRDASGVTTTRSRAVTFAAAIRNAWTGESPDHRAAATRVPDWSERVEAFRDVLMRLVTD